MGKWSDNETMMKYKVREEIIKSLWDKINSKDILDDKVKDLVDENAVFENRISKFKILKMVLGLLKDGNKENSKKFDDSIREGNFEAFEAVVEAAIKQAGRDKLAAERGDSVLTDQDLDIEIDNKLSEIKNGERLSLTLIDTGNPNISHEDVSDLIEYMREMEISAAVSISNNDKQFVVPQEKFGSNPVFAIHSIGKVFAGILLMKIINEQAATKPNPQARILSEEDFDKPIQLSQDVLKELSTDVQARLQEVTLRQIMLHKSGLGDYLDNPEGLSAAIEKSLDKGEQTPEITTSHDLLKFGEKEKKTLGPVGQFKYSNFGMLLLGFAIEKKYQDDQKERKEVPLLGIDEIMRRFVHDDVKMQIFESKRPDNGQFNSTHQRSPRMKQGEFFTDKTDDYIEKYVSARFGCTAGGYWTTNEDLQKFGQWIIDKCTEDPNFRRLIEKHGGEFYNAGKQAVEHSGFHADTAHFYASLRNGTIITALSDQGEGAATKLVDTILTQTTWYKLSLGSQNKEKLTLDDPIGSQVPRISPAFDSIISAQQASHRADERSDVSDTATEQKSFKKKQ